MTSEPKHVVVLGLMGVGKSTTAIALAAELGRPLSDSDQELQRSVSDSGARIAARLGVSALHQIERGLLVMALARTEPHVIAAAASVIEDAEVRRLLGEVVVVVISADVETIHTRQQAGGHRRKMTTGELREIADRRELFFADAAHLTVDGTAPTDEIVARIMTFLDEVESAS